MRAWADADRSLFDVFPSEFRRNDFRRTVFSSIEFRIGSLDSPPANNVQ